MNGRASAMLLEGDNLFLRIERRSMLIFLKKSQVQSRCYPSNLVPNVVDDETPGEGAD